MRRSLLLLLLVPTLVLAGCAGKGPSAGEMAGHDDESMAMSKTYRLRANLAPPVTTYNVTEERLLTFPGAEGTLNDSSYTYTWSNTNKCGRFTNDRGFAVWHHGDDTNCPHDSTHHDGTITVVIGNLSETIASTGYATCEWVNGSTGGAGNACFVSSVAPEGQPAARGTSIPWSMPAAVAGIVVAAIALRRRGLR